MTLGDLFELALGVALAVLLLLLLAGAVRHRPSKHRGVPWKKRLRKFARYTAIRLPIALGFGLAVFVLGAAGLTLNSHRPPGDNSPVISVPPRAGSGIVDVKVDSCEGDAEVRVRYSGRRRGDSGPPRFFTDGEGLQRFAMRAHPVLGDRRGSFELETPLARRGLLSCYLQLPVLRGPEDGYKVRLNLDELMQVDTQASVPPPDAYNQGRWTWTCEAGRTCPAFATIELAIEDGTKQVIVLVLASIFGALIALLVGEVLIEWARRRFRHPDGSR